MLSVHDYVHSMICRGKSIEEISHGIIATFSPEEIYHASSLKLVFDSRTNEIYATQNGYRASLHTLNAGDSIGIVREKVVDFLGLQVFNSYGNGNLYFDIKFSGLSLDYNLLYHIYGTIENKVLSSIYALDRKKMKEQHGEAIPKRFKEQMSNKVPVKSIAEAISTDFDIETIYTQSMFRFGVCKESRTLNSYIGVGFHEKLYEIKQTDNLDLVKQALGLCLDTYIYNIYQSSRNMCGTVYFTDFNRDVEFLNYIFNMLKRDIEECLTEHGGYSFNENHVI